MKIEYSIKAEPRSFSLWTTPGARAVDLSDYDRFVIYAKGSVSSFTLVVKDRSSDPEGKTPKGIADCIVRGVTPQWQRFEPAFKDFKSRQPGTAIEWTALNHVGVALIHPYNPPTGTLQVDNLRALPAE